MHQRWRYVASAFHRSESILGACSFARFHRRTLKWLSIAVAVATVVPVVLLSTRRPPAHAIVTTSELIRTLPFTLVTAGDRLSLDWDRESPAIQAAECGVLWIADGGIHRRLVLDASQLRAGKLFYWPLNKDVSFQLTMADGQMACAKQSAAPLEAAQSPANRDERAERLASRNPLNAAHKAEHQPIERQSEDLSAHQYTRIVSPNAPAFAVEGESQQAPMLAVYAVQVPEGSARQVHTTAIHPALPLPPETSSSVSVEAVPETRMSRFVSKIPLLRRLHRTAEIVPPKPVRETTLTIPAELRRTLKSEVPVDVRAYVDRSGKVIYAEMVSDFTEQDRDLATLAVFNARHWEFTPAQAGGRPVAGQIILHYRFGNPLLASSRDEAP